MPLPSRLPMLLAALLLPAAAGADEAAEVQRLARGGEMQAALQRADRSLAADPRDAGLRFVRGVLLLDAGRDADAMAAFQSMAEDFPELPEPYNNIALLHARAGDLDQARAALETALRADPAQPTVRRNLGDVYLRLAMRAWDAAAGAQPADDALQRRLRLARELLSGG